MAPRSPASNPRWLPRAARGQSVATLLVALVLLSACAAVPYQFGEGLETSRTLQLGPGEPQFERGQPNKVIDGLGHYLFSLPAKLILFNWRVDNHDISEEVEDALREYLHANDLHHVKVRLNQYAPGGEWSRLFRNRDVGLLWRMTAGVLTVAFDTLLPQRLFGGDRYNPFTNTVSLSSDLRPIALHEGGHAKDFAQAPLKGTYAALRMLPILPLFQEGKATSDALGYESERGTPDDERRAYRLLYPAYGTYVGGEAATWVGSGWVTYAIQYGAVIPGHAVGWIASALVDDDPPPDERETEDTLARPAADVDARPQVPAAGTEAKTQRELTLEVVPGNETDPGADRFRCPDDPMSPQPTLPRDPTATEPPSWDHAPDTPSSGSTAPALD
jgi:hypothetical protein